ncbi:Hypothetical predicted protein [Mytilus galloprovincialis]|uniref:Uncharacterized protein n=1 Tax=Mytilus galloprovincialis TaxID=29158 RepID=A0A8B6C8G6_MYTGA|nr:Hypothetical predicted protein [Mytilus galloprovincialis]
MNVSELSHRKFRVVNLEHQITMFCSEKESAESRFIEFYRTPQQSRTQLAKEEKALQMVEGKKNVSTTTPPTIPKDVPASPTIIEELSTDEDLPALLSEEEETQLPLKKRRIVKKIKKPIVEELIDDEALD